MQQWMFRLALFREVLMWKLVRQLVYITEIANHNNTLNLSRKILECENDTSEVENESKINNYFHVKSFPSITDILGINLKTIVQKNCALQILKHFCIFITVGLQL